MPSVFVDGDPLVSLPDTRMNHCDVDTTLTPDMSRAVERDRHHPEPKPPRMSLNSERPDGDLSAAGFEHGTSCRSLSVLLIIPASLGDLEKRCIFSARCPPKA